MYGQDFNQYMYELQQHIQKQENRINTLEEKLQRLITNQKEEGNVTIEKIEYKFDQLKVETLSGSLHIGLSPEDLKQVEDLALGQMDQQKNVQTLSPFEEQLSSELNQWLQQSGPVIINDLANSHHRSLDDSHLNLLLQDIQKQFPKRISHYKEQAENNHTNEEEMKEFVLNQIKKEVHHSLTNYMKNNKGE